MGCCFSSDDDKDLGSNEADERTRLLADPVSNNATPRTALGYILRLCSCCKSCCTADQSTKDVHSTDGCTVGSTGPLSDGTRAPGLLSSRESDNYHQVQQQQKGDSHQNALDRILHNAARNVIDVAAMDGQTVENHEYYDRSRQYSNTLNARLGSGRTRSYKQALPNCSTAPQNILSAPPVSLSDIQLISQVTDKVCKAVRDVKVDHKEDLVVPFGVP